MPYIIAIIILVIILISNNRDREKAWDAEAKSREWAFSLKHEKEKLAKELEQLRKSSSQTINQLNAENSDLRRRLAKYEEGDECLSATKEETEDIIYDDDILPF
ncbi:MAG: hypothetical protein E7462_01290 [Ruminococcaceae bacterium]|nr:hypothetical protein [Oscillospiraceae bacterium]